MAPGPDRVSRRRRLPARGGPLLAASHPRLRLEQAEGPPTAWHRATLLVLAITLHNVPEGLAVGVAFAAAAQHLDVAGGATLGSAIALAIGIGLQNFPEGLAVAMPLRREGVSPLKSLWYGQLSALVEPIAAVTGAAAVLLIGAILPSYALAFAAGAMIYVVIEELIPESQAGGNADLATLATMGGFAVIWCSTWR